MCPVSMWPWLLLSEVGGSFQGLNQPWRSLVSIVAPTRKLLRHISGASERVDARMRPFGLLRFLEGPGLAAARGWAAPRPRWFALEGQGALDTMRRLASRSPSLVFLRNGIISPR